MNKKLIIVLLIAFNLPGLQRVSAQGFLDRIKQKAKEKLNQRADKKVDKGIDNTLDKADPANPASEKTVEGTTLSTSKENLPGVKTIGAYKNYDFVPGDNIIFDSGLADERTGEIPSKFLLNRGQADVQVEDGENVIHIPKGANASISPRLIKGANLPEAYTIEFDFKDENYGVNHINVDFGYRVGSYSDDRFAQGVGFSDQAVNWKHGDVAYPVELTAMTKVPMQWHHFAITINKDAAKAYIDQFRVISLNDLNGDHTHLNIEAIAYENSYIKNIRIATGGIGLYKRVTTNSRIITHGILFDVDKSVILPTSMGTLNNIYTLMQQDPALKFEIDGHTDNSGTPTHNLALSQSRAEAVKEQLINMGIASKRLTIKGYGDTKPIGKNDSPEDKANNRRVEFLKI